MAHHDHRHILGILYGLVLGITEYFLEKQFFPRRSLGVTFLLKSVVSLLTLVLLVAPFVRQDETTQIVREGYFSSSDLEKDLEDVDCLIMHSMLPPFANALPKVPEAVLVMWSGWGFDYSHIIEESLGELVFEKTLQLKNIARAKALFSADGIRRIWFRRKVIFGKKRKLQGVPNVKDALDSAMKRLDVFSVMPGEVEILKKSRANLRARHHMIQVLHN